MTVDRRSLFKGLAAAFALHPAIARALEIPARVKTGTLMDVEHIVILTQENRSFDHYFGSLNGVRGFGDRFPIPLPDAPNRKSKTVWTQPDKFSDATLLPFHVDTQANFKYMRLEGTPHTWSDAQDAWNDGRLDAWPRAKYNHSMGYFTRTDIPFQYALAEAFTLCDAYHCALHAGTDPNRLFIFSGANDPQALGHGPVVYNAYDKLSSDEHGHGGYTWTTYPERLQAAGVTWQVYQKMGDNYDDNPLVGFRLYREADKATDGPLTEIARRAIRTRDLNLLKADVLADKLPQVSWVVAPDVYSEHPMPSSPAQGADYTARVLDALTANPEVWAKTVFLINFDENDGLFDHVPPPAPPSQEGGVTRGDSQVDTTGEYYVHGKTDDHYGRAFGLGPRVPLYVVSPWSKGGFVASETFDHTSVIRFIEARFGVHEPNISGWRRAVCGDLTSCFNFADPDGSFPALPATADASRRADKLFGRSVPPLPRPAVAPVQEEGLRPRRATPYRLGLSLLPRAGGIGLSFHNASRERAAVFHLYDRNDLKTAPRRYTVAAGQSLDAEIAGDAPDLWILGPNGFHRHLVGPAMISADLSEDGLRLDNLSAASATVSVEDGAYGAPLQTLDLGPNESRVLPFDLCASHNWYDLIVRCGASLVRLAGHVETGAPSLSDPAAHGAARLDQPSLT
ncbi:MAG: phosphocholine-specific phospholipase C [Asticcacaulis sp.]|uniref:phosphocholine-specific phospholipase C n=1 Tax=Asticcacaulis sp. TaxID=1872648 RepID=UPI003F7C3623